jgi:hypothetical protein
MRGCPLVPPPVIVVFDQSDPPYPLAVRIEGMAAQKRRAILSVQYASGVLSPAGSSAGAMAQRGSSTDAWSLLSNVYVGPDTSGNFALTARGLAVCRQDGTCVTVERGGDRLLDVTAFKISGVDPTVYQVPRLTRHIRPGDLIITSDSPFPPLFVLPSENNRVHGLNPITGEIADYVPFSNPFVDVSVVAVSAFDLLRRRRGRRGERDDDALEHGPDPDDFVLPFLLLAGQNAFRGAGWTGSAGATPGSMSPAGTPASQTGVNPLLLGLILGGDFGASFGLGEGRGEHRGGRSRALREALLLAALQSSQNSPWGGGVASAGAGSAASSALQSPLQGNLALFLFALALDEGNER